MAISEVQRARGDAVRLRLVEAGSQASLLGGFLARRSFVPLLRLTPAEHCTRMPLLGGSAACKTAATWSMVLMDWRRTLTAHCPKCELEFCAGETLSGARLFYWAAGQALQARARVAQSQEREGASLCNQSSRLSKGQGSKAPHRALVDQELRSQLTANKLGTFRLAIQDRLQPANEKRGTLADPVGRGLTSS